MSDDPIQRPPHPFYQRLQNVWDNPTPFSLFAQIKAVVDAVRNVPRVMDDLATSTTYSPSTEEEAYWYNRARDRLPGESFDIARTIAPGVPRGTGGVFARPIGGFARPGHSVTPPNFPSGALGRQGMSPPRFAPERFPGDSGAGGGFRRISGNGVPAALSSSLEPRSLEGRGQAWSPQLPPSVGRLPNGSETSPIGIVGLLSREAERRPPFATSEQPDPNLRRLERVVVPGSESVPAVKSPPLAPGDVPAFRERPLEKPATPINDDGLDIPDFLRRQSTQEPESADRQKKWTDLPPEGFRGPGTYRRGGGGGGGGGGGRRGSGSGGGEDPCDNQAASEIDDCWSRKEDYVHRDYVWGCIDRANLRRDWCKKPGGKPEPKKWVPPDEETWRNYGR